MALEVNSQNLFQNAQFQQFVDFAEAAAKAGKQRAVARVDPGEVGGIANRTIRPGSGDWVGIGSSEHAAVNFTLSRDDATGAITVKYESPEKLPIYFSWTATIDVDGNVTSTPLEVMDQAAIAASKAGADGQRDGNVVIVP